MPATHNPDCARRYNSAAATVVLPTPVSVPVMKKPRTMDDSARGAAGCPRAPSPRRLRVDSPPRWGTTRAACSGIVCTERLERMHEPAHITVGEREAFGVHHGVAEACAQQGIADVVH